jgi:predicted Fe-S protein YdhL (DUF1289 family)
MKRTLQRVFLTLSAAFVLLPGASAFAQRSAVPPPRPNPQQRPVPLAKRPNPPTRQMLDLPPIWIERLQDMPPAQQERFLANNERFRSLPPQRQDQIRKRLQVWNNLTPDQRQALIERQLVWEQMTPGQQRYVRETLLPQWQGMPPARRQIVLKKLRDMRDLDDSQRNAKLNDPSFVSGLSPDEQHMLRDLATLRISGPEPPPGS